LKTLDNLLLFADAYCLGIQDLLGNLIPWWFQRTQLFHTAVVRRLFFLGSLLLIPLWDVLPLGCPGSSVISEDHSCLRTAQWYGGFSFEEVCSVPASGRCVCLDGVQDPLGILVPRWSQKTTSVVWQLFFRGSLLSSPSPPPLLLHWADAYCLDGAT
jgi:hypothetical protein